MEIMSYVKLVEVLNWFGDNVDSDIQSVEILSGTHVEINGQEYMALTEDEAKEEFIRHQEDLLDEMGLGAFSEWARNHILENFVDKEWFDEALRESCEGYAEDIKHEENRLQEEMEERGCDTEEEFVESLCEDYRDGLEWYVEHFGYDQLKEVCEKNGLLDTDEIIDWIEETDGRGCLASYDGIENESGDIYIYRVN